MNLVLTPEERAMIVDRVTEALVAEGKRILRDELAERLDPLTPARAARMLSITPETLNLNHVKWELTKSLALGSSNPRYFRRQITARLNSQSAKPARHLSPRIEAIAA